jgi:hypothetical protein
VTNSITRDQGVLPVRRYPDLLGEQVPAQVLDAVVQHDVAEGAAGGDQTGQGFQKVMEGVPVVIWDDELIAGSQTRYIRGAYLSTEFNPYVGMELLKKKEKLAGIKHGPPLSHSTILTELLLSSVGSGTHLSRAISWLQMR